jgi:2'-5' RNA ligase
MQLYNLSLIPNENFSKKLVRYSQSISEVIPYRLGENSLPHLTILQFFHEDIAQIKGLVARYEQNISTKGFSFARFKDLDSWGVEVLKDQSLIDLQGNYLEKLEVDPVNGTGACFQPHFTLCGWQSQSKLLREFTIDEELIYQVDIQCRLHLGKSTENFQYERIIV